MRSLGPPTRLLVLLAAVHTASSFPPSSKPPYFIMWCHGSGDTGEGARGYVNAIATERTLLALTAEGVQFEFPTATPRPYQLAGGRL
eukprot:CAMPEP_0119497104 /NCGR_PEP_ID=MMETSP1344-20130328/20253_1 /TAXON_ID=236787 /ORGANISM="Florenciella parvula, Strain CCMP2471" /LENGTH=86 /DNA_ID=CAMNT_0007532863 /DNA_START=17 /DNA_END=274 /DNA_ORIENTATION=+